MSTVQIPIVALDEEYRCMHGAAWHITQRTNFVHYYPHKLKVHVSQQSAQEHMTVHDLHATSNSLQYKVMASISSL